MRGKELVYYESLNSRSKDKKLFMDFGDERIETKVAESTRLTCTLLCTELEHPKIETKLINATPLSEMGEYPSVM